MRLAGGERMKIAYISKYSYPVKTGGAEISNKLLLENIKGMEIIELYENYRYDHIKPFSLRKLYSYFRMLTELRGKGVDLLIITQTNWSSVHGVFLSKMLRAKLVVNECGDYWRQRTNYKKVVGRYTLNSCDGITVRTQFMKDYILQFHPELGDKVRVIPNSIDLSDYGYTPYDDVESTGEGAPLIFSFFGRLATAKDPFKLLEIASQLKQKDPTLAFEIHIYGRGDLREELERAIKREKLEKYVKLMGVIHHTQIKDAITRSFLVLMPSKWEPQGRVILEAFACGRPILVSGVGGMAEAMGKENPHICNSDTSLYVSMILEMVRDRDHYQEVCLDNLEHSKEFDIKVNAEKFAEYFREVAGY